MGTAAVHKPYGYWIKPAIREKLLALHKTGDEIAARALAAVPGNGGLISAVYSKYGDKNGGGPRSSAPSWMRA